MSNSAKDLEDVDDDLFVSRKPKNYIFAEKKANDLTERTNKMLINSRQILQETEQIGQSTLENLSIQREGLERAEDNLDHINATTRATQKNLNNLSSFFGGWKSFFSRKDQSAAASAQTTAINGSMPRSKTLTSMPSNNPAGPSSSSSTTTGSRTNMSNRPSFAATSMSQDTSEDKDEFDANLSAIGFGLGTLKEMATRLGDEISDQNEMLDRITEKSERAGDTVKHQNRQIQQILKKG